MSLRKEQPGGVNRQSRDKFRISLLCLRRSLWCFQCASQTWTM